MDSRWTEKHEDFLSNRILPIRNELQKVMVGQKNVIKRVVQALFAVGQRDLNITERTRFLGTGHVLVDGPVGTGKTVLCKYLSIIISGDSKRVSGVPDNLTSDITGCEIILLTGKTQTVHGPIFCNVFLADEINRNSPKAQNAFIEALAEGTVTVGNQTYKLNQPFFCMATQNPTESQGANNIQEALRDRFMFKLIMGETMEEEKVEILQKTRSLDIKDLKPLITSEEINETRVFFFDNTYVSEAAAKVCAKLMTAINHPEKFGLFEKERKLVRQNHGRLFKQNPAVNDRASLHLEGAAMMEAAMNRRAYVLPKDVYNVAADVFRVRLMLEGSTLANLLDEFGDEYQTETEVVDYLLEELLEKAVV